MCYEFGQVVEEKGTHKIGVVTGNIQWCMNGHNYPAHRVLWLKENTHDCVLVGKIQPYKNDRATVVFDGVTVCCGYGLGADVHKVRYCPMCGREIIHSI